MITPLAKRIMVLNEVETNETESGIILSSNNVEKTVKAKVVSLGAEVPKDFENKTIIYNRYSGIEIKDNGEIYNILSFEDVIAFSE